MQCKNEQADKISIVVPERKRCVLKTFKCDEYYNGYESLNPFIMWSSVRYSRKIRTNFIF